MFKKIFLVGASVATLAGGALTTAGPAAADSYLWYGDAGYGQFYSSGEYLYACDQKGDGYGINVEWYVQENPANHGVVRDGDGNNGVCGFGNLSITDGHHILYRVCITNNGSTLSCTGYLQDTA